jgi:uncharacterized protein HemX
MAGWSTAALLAIAGGALGNYIVGQVSQAEALAGVYEAQNADTTHLLTVTMSDLASTREALDASDRSRRVAEVKSATNAEKVSAAQQRIDRLQADIECLEAESKEQYIAGLLDGISTSGQSGDDVAVVD